MVETKGKATVVRERFLNYHALEGANAIVISARIYRPSFHENKPKTLVFSHTKRAFWACFRENWVYNFGHRERLSNYQPLEGKRMVETKGKATVVRKRLCY